jgi:lipoyl(octanoyl) transferase
MQGLAQAQETVIEAASVVGQQCSTDPSSSPKKRKSWGASSDQANSQHTESCRRTASTTCASSAGGASVGSCSSGTSQINKHWREKICEWAYQVVDHFDLNREVVSTAMSHLDRFLGVYNGTVDKNLFQLLAMTCLYLSIKLNEYKHLLIPGSKSSMDTILQLSRGFFTLKEMEKMEYEVLQRLRWHVHPPTAQLFVKHFLFFLSVEEHELHDLAQFMIELSVMDYFFVSYKPSEIAMAALLNSMDRLGNNVTSRTNFPITRFINIHSPAILACRERLSLIYAQANEQADMEDSEDTPVRPEATAEPVEPSRLQRTISPVSVMAPPETNDETNHFGCQQQQFIDTTAGDSMDTDDYFVGYYND